MVSSANFFYCVQFSSKLFWKGIEELEKLFQSIHVEQILLCKYRVCTQIFGF